MPSSANHCMRYEEFSPWPELSPFLRAVWTLEGHARDLGGEAQRVLPDGCPELIVHFGDHFERVEDSGIATTQAPLLFAGQLTRELVLRPTGQISVLGVRFQPHGAAAVLRVPQRDLAGTTLALEDVSPGLGRAMAHVRDAARTLPHAAELAQRALARALRPERHNSRLAHVVAAIDRRHGLVSIDRLAAEAGLTRRHLERQFQHQVGVSPKRLARIARFQRALRVLEDTGAPARGAVTAAACGYADQAHFIRDFRALAGTAPTGHLLNKGVLTGFFTAK